jgi:hypothetical protein
MLDNPRTLSLIVNIEELASDARFEDDLACPSENLYSNRASQNSQVPF